MAEEKKQNFIGGAAILGVAAILTKLLGACFRIPLANIIGDSGMGYYQTAYPIYTALLMISTSGIPTAISRMVAERRAKNDYIESERVFKLSMRIMIILGVVTGIILAVIAKPFCNAIKEPDAVYSMWAVVPALVLCPVMSSFRGYFQGMNNMMPTGISQVIEQFFRVGTGLGLSLLLIKIDLPHAAAGATFGASAGGLACVIFMLMVYLRKKDSNRALIDAQTRNGVESSNTSGMQLLKEMLAISIPITLGSMIMPVINSIDTIIVKSRLVSIGYESDAARAMFGQLTGMASPIINMPDAITAAVAMSLVPVIANANKKGDIAFVRENSQLALRYAVLVGLPCVFGIACLSKPIMLLLYPLQKEAAINAAKCLVAYSAGIVFLAVQQALSGILQGIGKQNVPVISLLAGAVVKIAVTYVLCGIPSINVRGAAYGTVAAYLISALLNYAAVKKYTGVTINIGLTFIKPLISSGFMGLIAWLVYRLCSNHLGNAVSTLAAVCAGVLSYVILVFATGSITTDDMRAVKKLRKVADLLDKLNPVRKM